MARKTRKKAPKDVETLTHDEAKRTNIPTAEYQSVMEKEEQSPIRVAYERRNRDLDPQLVWRGKDEQDWSDLVVQAPPLYIQEKVHPKVLIDDLMSRTKERAGDQPGDQIDLFADFNGLPEEARSADFYQHEANWTNRMILGDSLQVMASLAEREGLRGKVQCIYFDPPYGIKFNSNFQWSTTSRDVKDGKTGHITREPEQVRAFRDTWRDGTHSYLTYLRDRLTVTRDLLAETGSVFIQIGDENTHRVRAVLDEVFSPENFIAEIVFRTTAVLTQDFVGKNSDRILWYAKRREEARLKYRQLYQERTILDDVGGRYTRIETAIGRRRFLSKLERSNIESLPKIFRIYRHDNLTSQDRTETGTYDIEFQGHNFGSSPESVGGNPFLIDAFERADLPRSEKQ